MNFFGGKKVTPSVRSVGGWGYNPPPLLFEDNPLLVTVKFGLGVEFDPLRKVKYPNSSLNCYKLMSDIIQSFRPIPKNSFCNGL